MGTADVLSGLNRDRARWPVVAQVFRVPIGGFTPVVLGAVNSNSAATTANNVITSAVSFNHTFDFETNVYFVRVTLRRSAANQVVRLYSIVLEGK